MAQLVRVYVDMQPEMAAELEQRAQELGMSESDLIWRCFELGKTFQQYQFTDEEKRILAQRALDFPDEPAQQPPATDQPEM